MTRAERLALPLSAASLTFSALALPLTYLVVPFCRPPATLLDLSANVGVVSAASVLAFAGLFLSLFSAYSLGGRRARLSIAMAAGSLAIATAYIVFGLVLRTCPM